ncbi:hypothetical protein SBOR_7466 [Sclerotinia borealis F-4128]|uniref:Uncharacterized protein n=1 Tax=Sclerotinia borealis (strain F-4128) TaxID=1432307 RepID=W9CBB1_SCLBF|nr:hypothetical protein SBOR_7466 [Sclerotinia borealis F-4128]
MNLFFSILLFTVALVAAATSGRDASTSFINAMHNEVRALSDGGLSLSTSLVTANNVVVATASAVLNSSLVSTAVDQASAAALTSDGFPPIGPGHSNIHSSSHDSTTVVISTVTLVPITSTEVAPFSSSSLSAVDSSKAALISSTDFSASTSHEAPSTSDLTQSSAVQSSTSQSLIIQPSPLQSSAAPSYTSEPLGQSSTLQPSTVQSSTAESSIVQSSAAETSAALSAAQSSEAPSYTAQPSVIESSESGQSSAAQSYTAESSATESSAESGTSQVSAAPTFPTFSSSNAPFANSTASLVQSSGYYGTAPSIATAPVTSASSPSSSSVSVIVGTPQSIISNSSPSTPASDSIGATETSTTSTTTITSTTTRTGTITTTITRSSADITSQSIIGKLPVTDAPSAPSALTTETFTSGGSTWTTTETGPGSTVTASLMLNPTYSASDNAGIATNNAATSSGACTCPSQVTVTVTATPFVVTGGTLTGTATSTDSPQETSDIMSSNYPQESSVSSSSPQKSSVSSSSERSTTYAAPPQEAWTTRSVPGFIGVTIPSGGMSYPSVGSTSFPGSLKSSTTSCTETTSTYGSHVHPHTKATPILSSFSNYSSTSTGSLLGTSVGTGVGTAVTPITTLPSGILPPVSTSKPPIYSGNADVNAVGTESVALIVGLVALVLLF